MTHLDLLSRLARPGASKIVLLVLDGIGDIRTREQPQTALDLASTPNFDSLAAGGCLGRLIPVELGITPGSGPGHLALFGYDTRLPEVDIGRGVLEALGLGLEVRPGEVAVRGNFATADDDGNLTDRRAGRPSTADSRRLCALLQEAADDLTDIDARVVPGESHRFVLILRGPGMSWQVADTDPQQLGVPPLSPRAVAPEAEDTAAHVSRLIAAFNERLFEEPRANRVLFRGFSELPKLPSFTDLYQLRAGAFAGYPLYRGVASACGMEVVPASKKVGELFTTVGRHWDQFDFFFLHVKQTDAAGEDGNLAVKAEVVEEADEALPGLLDLGPDVIAVTGDHSTPAPMKAHSWHPVPLLLSGSTVFVDETTEFSETAAVCGHLGTLGARFLMGLLLAHAGRLAKFGA